MSAPRCIWPLGATLGEGPAWHPAEGALYFVDIKQHKLHRVDADGGNRQSWDMPGETGFALPAKNGGLVCGLPGRLVHFAPETGTFTPVAQFEEDRPGNRLNDGHVAHDGALWFGSMDNAEESPSGALYRYRGGLTKHDDGIVITNGPAFSPDRKTFYHTDTLGKLVHAFDVNEDGTLANKRVFLSIPSTVTGAGWPDGTAVDAEGGVWIAYFGGARVERYSPAGELLATVPFPVPNVTKIAFGGPDLKTAFATTARKGLTDEQLAAAPLAGGVFAFPVDVPGLPQHLIELEVK